MLTGGQIIEIIMTAPSVERYQFKLAMRLKGGDSDFVTDLNYPTENQSEEIYWHDYDRVWRDWDIEYKSNYYDIFIVRRLT